MPEPGHLHLNSLPETALPLELTLNHARGTYTIPYIQSSRNLKLTVPDRSVEVRLAGVTPAQAGMYCDLPAGEHTIEWRRPGGTWQTAFNRIGVGTIIACLGDSLTEGYLGNAFFHPTLQLRAADFPAETVSSDGRNYPTFSPTAARHKPSVNCQQSWLPSLNNLLTSIWKQPVFLANEGWGGYTAGNYLSMMKDPGTGWAERMRNLQPQIWLLHLGVNDERHFVSPDDFSRDMQGIVELLCRDFGATTSAIYIARPSFDYFPGAEPILRDYLRILDQLLKDLNIQPGPDFFTAFSSDKPRWYGNDPVHPGPEGMDWMARLWAEALQTSHPSQTNLTRSQL